MPLVGVAETLEIVFWYFNLSNLVMLALTDGKTLLVKYRNASRWGMKTQSPGTFQYEKGKFGGTLFVMQVLCPADAYNIG
jgi:hypothetical protein